MSDNRIYATYPLVTLKANGALLRIRLGALAEASHLYPLKIDVLINDIPVGAMVLTSSKEKQGMEESFTLPESVDREKPIEVKLVPRLWVMHTFESRSYIASCRVLSLTCP